VSNNEAPRRVSPLVVLSLCLSLLAVGLSLTALLIVYDQMTLSLRSRQSVEIRAVKWNWKERIDKVEADLDRAHYLIGQKSEESATALEKQLDAVCAELRAWIRAAEPRLKDTVAQMEKQAEQLRAAIGQRSEQAAEKLKALQTSIGEFRKKVAARNATPKTTGGSSKSEKR